MNMLSALYCETVKVLRSLVFWLTFVFFAISLTIVSLVYRQRSWTVFLDDFLLISANMGMLISSFIASWVFGREFMDKTNKDLIAKPISRATVMLSKFIIIFLWDIVFMIFLFFFLLFIGLFLGLTGFSSSLAMGAFQKFVVTFLLYIVISTPGALFSSISKGILAPIGILFIQVIAANMLSNTGAAPYFPWTIPPKFYMNSVSIVILIATGVAGLAGTLAWWRFAEQK